MRSTRLRRRRRSWNIVVALALAAAAVVLSGCDAALQPDGAGTGQPAGDAIVRSFTWRGSGDQVFFLNPGGEALDRTLYTLRLGGRNSAEVYVIATAGAEEADPQIEIVDLTGAAASRVGTAALRSQPRPPSEPAPEPAWRKDLDDAARRLLRRSAPRLPSAPPWPQRAVVPGSRETFRDILDFSGDFNSIPATARAVVTDGTVTAVVWVADREWACGEGCVTQPLVDGLAGVFLRPGSANDIYDWLTAIFGDPWGPHRKEVLIPPQAASEIHILLFDIHEDGLPGDGVAGFFHDLHTFRRAGDPPVAQGSNERLMFFVDSPVLTAAPGLSLGTLAHEFQHLIHYYQKEVARDIESETWLNEMASEVAEDLVADKLGVRGPRGVASGDATAGDADNRFGRLPEYNRYNDIQVTAWGGTLANYSINYALGAYLARNYGGAELFSRIVQSGRSGVEAVEGALRELGHEVPFPQLLANWAAANLLSDNTAAPVPYRYNPGTWSTSRAGGATSIEFRLGSINLYNYTPRRPRGYPDRPGPHLHDLIAFNARAQPPHSNMYTTLGRVAGTLRLRVTAPAGNRVTVVVKE